MWEERNKVVHGNDSASQSRARHKKIANELRFLHTHRDKVLATDRDIFIGTTEDDLETHISKSAPRHIANWLKIWKPVVLDSVKAAKAFSIRCVRPLHTYFPTSRPLTNPKRPPKPRYTNRAHLRYDSHDRVRRRTRLRPKFPSQSYQITQFFSRRAKAIAIQTPLPV